MGKPLDRTNLPSLLKQKSVNDAETALARIAEVVKLSPNLICLDEVTAHLTPEDAVVVLEEISKIAKDRAVLMVSHNQAQVAAYGDSVILVAGGKVQEHSPAKQFFVAPQSDPGRQFLNTGGAIAVPPDADPRYLSPELRGIPEGLAGTLQTRAEEDSLCWILKGKLAAFITGAKGLNFEKDVPCLAENDVTSLLFFGANPPAPAGVKIMADAGVKCFWHPLEVVKDVSRDDLYFWDTSHPEGMPTREDSAKISSEITSWMGKGEKFAIVISEGEKAAAFMIGAQLVYLGIPAGMATEVVSELRKDLEFGPEEEQLLWDLELNRDLQDDRAPGNSASSESESESDIFLKLLQDESSENGKNTTEDPNERSGKPTKGGAGNWRVA
ncbi:MAG: hypothetical protein HUJ27_17530 [Rhodobacteraceae bacterium]|nr:hypothetical protein [Paracoccaceae bacterium]